MKKFYPNLKTWFSLLALFFVFSYFSVNAQTYTIYPSGWTSLSTGGGTDGGSFILGNAGETIESYYIDVWSYGTYTFNPSFTPTIASISTSGYSSGNIYQTSYSASGLNISGGSTWSVNIEEPPSQTVLQSGTVTLRVIYTLADETAPTWANCPSDVNDITAAGDCYRQVGWTHPLASDNVDESLTIDFSTSPTVPVLDLGDYAFGQFPVGITTVTYTATDDAGNVGTCTFYVTIADEEDPVLTNCPPDLGPFYIAPGDSLSDYVNWQQPTPSDNCPSFTFTSSELPYSRFSVGVTEVKFLVVDASGNKDSCSMNVTVLDTVDPVAYCIGAETVYLDETGNISVNPADFDNGSTDNVSIAGFSLSQSSFDCSDLGINNITFTVTDGSGNTDNCSTSITVLDTISPTPQGRDISVALDANGSFTVPYDSMLVAGTFEVQMGVYLYSYNRVGIYMSHFPEGYGPEDLDGYSYYGYTLNYYSNNGTWAYYYIDYTYENSTPTSWSVFGETESAWFEFGSSADNCSDVTVTMSDSTFTCSDIGTNAITVTTTDGSNNVVQKNVTITVADTTSPVASCQNITAYLGVDGTVTIDEYDVDNGSSDNCGIASMSISSSSFDCSHVGGVLGTTSNIIEQTSSNAGGGSSGAWQSWTATVDGALNYIEVYHGYANSSISTVIYLELYDGEGTDGQLIASATNTNTVVPLTSMQYYRYNFDGVQLEKDHQYTWRLYFTTAQNAMFLSFANNTNPYSGGIGYYSPGDLNDDYLFKINATEIEPYTTTLTVTDNYGNTDECIANVWVKDTISPVAVCQDVTVYLDATGSVSIDSSDINNGSSDNCDDIVNMTLSQSTFTCNDEGDNNVTLTVTDGNGNSDYCTATVTVVSASVGGTSGIAAGMGTKAIVTGGTVEFMILYAYDSETQSHVVYIDMREFPEGVSPEDIVSLQLYDLWDGPVTFINNDPSWARYYIYTDTPLDVAGSAYSSQFRSSGSGYGVRADVTYEYNVPITQEEVTICEGSTADLVVSGYTGNIQWQDSVAGGSWSSIEGATSSSYTTQALSSTTYYRAAVTYGECTPDYSSTSTVIVDDVISPDAICQDTIIYLDNTGNITIDSSYINNGSTDNCTVASISLSQSSFDCNDIGANTVTMTVYDAFGNSDQCTAQVTVNDSVSPVASCQNTTVYLDASGNASITGSDINNGSTDNCSIETAVASITSFTCDDIGANTVTLTVTDGSSNTDQCSATVTVADTTRPVISCSDLTVYLDASGSASIVVDDIENSATDNCSISSSELSVSSFTCADVGDNDVTLSVTDASNNIATCTATVTVSDTISPTAQGQDMTVYLDASGDVSISSSDMINGTVKTMSLSLRETVNYFGLLVSEFPAGYTPQDLDGQTFEIGGSSYTLYLGTINAYAYYNINSPLDLSSPTSYDVFEGATTFDFTFGEPTTDNCEVITVTLSDSTFTCSDVGANTITVTTEDQYNNLVQKDVTITVNDTISPVANCQNVTVYLDSEGNGSIDSTDVDNGSTDNCEIATIALSTSDFTCADVGANTVTVTVTDVNGNNDQCSATVTVEDTISPTAVAKDTTLYLDASGLAGITKDEINNGSSDNCSISSTSIDISSFDCSDVGENTVTLTVNDANGNSDTDLATVTVVDTVSPEAICQAGFTVYLDGSGNASISNSDIDNNSTDNCSIDSRTINVSNFSCADIGSNTVTLTVTDKYSNTDQCSTNVTVADTVSPVANCQNVTVYLDSEGNGSIDSTDVDNGSTDNCEIATIALSTSDFTCADVGANTVTVTVTDVNGNNDQCSATVTVEDTIAPVLAVKDTTLYLDASGSASITAEDVNVSSTDNCSISSVSIDNGEFGCADIVGSVYLLEFGDQLRIAEMGYSTTTKLWEPIGTAMDVTDIEDNAFSIDRNPSTGEFYLLAGYNDEESAVRNLYRIDMDTDEYQYIDQIVSDGGETHPQDMAFGNDGYLYVVFKDGDIDKFEVSTDVVSNLGNIANVGSGNGVAGITYDYDNNRLIYAYNVDDYSFTVKEIFFNGTVNDLYTLDAPETDFEGWGTQGAQAIEYMGNGVCLVSDSWGNDWLYGLDLKSGEYTFLQQPTGSGLEAVKDLMYAPNQVVVTATDANGNETTATAYVNVVDTISPDLTVNNLTVYLDSDGEASITPDDVVSSASDNCSVLDTLISEDSFSCSDVGTPVNVIVKLWDTNGNQDSEVAVITVSDTISPFANCQDVTIYLDESGDASIDSSDVDNGSTDNCEIATIALSKSDFTCADVGGNTVTMTVTDVNGNSSSCTSTVTVSDTISPTAVCQDVTVYLDATGSVSIDSSDIDNGSGDNCSEIATMTLEVSTFSCDNAGDNTVTLTVTDENSNSNYCTATVTVVDTVPPVALAKDTTIYLDASGQASLTAEEVNDGSGDACGIATMSLNKTTFGCEDVTKPGLYGLGIGSNWGSFDLIKLSYSNAEAGYLVDEEIAINGGDRLLAIDKNPIDGNVYFLSIMDELEGPYYRVLFQLDMESGDVTEIGRLISSGGNTYPQDFAFGDDGFAYVIYKDGTMDKLNVETGSTALFSEYGFETSGAGVTYDYDNDRFIVVAQSDIDEATIGEVLMDGTLNLLGPIAQPLEINIGESGFKAQAIEYIGSNECLVSGYDADYLFKVDLNDGEMTFIQQPIGLSYQDAGIKDLFFDRGSVLEDIVLTVADNSGNIDSSLVNISVLDTLAPELGVQSVTVYLDPIGKAWIDGADVVASATDNCSVVDTLLSVDTFYCDAVDIPVDVLVTITDASGNTDTATVVVTVLDTIKPEAQGKDLTLYLDENGEASIDVDSMLLEGSLSCGTGEGTVELGLDLCPNCSGFVIFTEDWPEEYEYDYFDGKSIDIFGSSYTLYFAFYDGDLLYSLDYPYEEDWSSSVSAGDVFQGASSFDFPFGNGGATYEGCPDNCGEITVSLSDTTFSCENTGANTITVYTTDLHDNVSEKQVSITVIDTILPLVAGRDTTIYLDASGQASLTANEVNDGSDDACGIDIISLSQTTFACADVGELEDIVLTVTDKNGNTDSTTVSVTVLDTLAPIASCQDAWLIPNGPGDLILDVDMIDNGSTDNCSIDTMYLSQTSFSPDLAGEQVEVTLTVKDIHNNLSTCTSMVTVSDTVPPELSCRNIGINLDSDDGESILYPAMLIDHIYDKGGIASTSVSIDRFDCNDLGVHLVELRVSDFGGNVTTCISEVTIEENNAPTVICNDFEVVLSSEGSAEISINDIDAGSTDACGIATRELSKTVFDTNDVGQNDVILYVTDVNGNTDSCTAVVTVLDQQEPVANCNSIDIFVTTPEGYELSDEDLSALAAGSSDDATSFDSLTIVATPSVFTCDMIGDTISVVVSVSDESGNESTCETEVFVGYIFDADIANVTVGLDSGQCETTIDYPDVFSVEHCGSITLIDGLGVNGIFPAGTSVETWEVVLGDITDTVSFEVTVIDSSLNSPSFDSISSIAARENEVVVVPVTGINDGSTCIEKELKLSASSLNIGLIESIDVNYDGVSTSGELTVNLVANQSGSAEIVVLLTDEDGAVAHNTFVLSVASGNSGPVLVHALPDTTVQAEDMLEMLVSTVLGDVFDDADGDVLTWSFMLDSDTILNWMSVSEVANDYILDFKPMQADTGCYNIIVLVSDSRGASARDTFEVCVTDIPVGVNDWGTDLVLVNMYPNPTKGSVTLDFGKINDNAEVWITDISGRLIFNKQYQFTDKEQIDLSNHVSGNYLVRMNLDGRVEMKKLILKK